MRLLLPVCHIFHPYSKLCPVSGILVDGSVSYSVNSHSSLESCRLLKFCFFFCTIKCQIQLPMNTEAARTVQDFCFVVWFLRIRFIGPNMCCNLNTILCKYRIRLHDKLQVKYLKFNLSYGLSKSNYGDFRPCSVFILGDITSDF